MTMATITYRVTCEKCKTRMSEPRPRDVPAFRLEFIDSAERQGWKIQSDAVLCPKCADGDK